MEVNHNTSIENFNHILYGHAVKNGSLVLILHAFDVFMEKTLAKCRENGIFIRKRQRNSKNWIQFPNNDIVLKLIKYR